MKRNKNSITIATVFIGILLMTIAFNGCEDREYNNPYDEKVEIDTLVPYDLQVKQTGIFERKLTWKCDAEKVEKFILDKKVGDANWQEAFAEVSGDTYEWTDTEIEMEKTHQYRVKAKFDEKTTPEVSLEFEVNMPAPTNLQTEELSDVSYKLLWEDNSHGEQGFRIDRKRNNQDWEINYGEVQANQTQFVDTNVFASRENNINVEYRVYTFYDQYESEKISTNTSAALTTPTNLQITSNSISSVTLSWQDNSKGEQGFRIERKYEGGTWNEIKETQTNSFEDTDFELNTRVYYRISSYYNQYSSSYLESDFDASIPAPENFEITQNTMTSVTLNWNYPYTGHDGFQIDRKVDDGSWETQYQIVDAATTSLTDEVDLENHDYTYRVIAILDDYQSVEIENTVSFIEMVTITGGTFEMGCTSEQSNCNSDETPVHTVTLSDFSISQYEITNAQYAVFLNDINCNSDGSYNDDEFGNVEYIDMDDSDCQVDYSGGQFIVESGKDNHPTIEVSWYGANAFAQWAGGRLPTEAEWEFAARGGNQSQGYQYSGSDNLDDVGWYYDNSSGQTHEVGQKQSNELGIYDMSGNVWEWCNDWYASDYYSNNPENNPQGPLSGSKRVLRGGSWVNVVGSSCRVANRYGVNPGLTSGGRGFRIAR